MKREVALRPLSREHLVALMAAKNLREAEDAKQGSEIYLTFWKEDGQRHFRIEDEVLIPFWAAHADVDKAGVARMNEEHLELRSAVVRFAAEEVTLDEVHALGDLLHDHVRFEERELFPLIEEALDDDLLSLLEAAVEIAEAESR
ncbi:MAG: hemerythrin domain-containing protein [Thermoleophilaceae bacterium]|nr:hemerythrin domain-containing protein [Thermoleophilaceae bacterium]